jgi:urease accessory protein
MSKTRYTNLIKLFLCFPITAVAHTGISIEFNFFAGLAHPISGIDHVLAMIAVGILATQIGGKALWGLPSAFITTMIIGGALGALQIHVPLIEAGIIASLLILGSIIATTTQFSIAVNVCIVGFLAIFHGLAHGLEMPSTDFAIAYGSGFTLTTTILHGTGIVIGTTLNKLQLLDFQRLVGGTIVVSGIALAISG